MHRHHKSKNKRFFREKSLSKSRNTREPGDIAKGRSHLKEEPHTTAARSWKKRTLNMHRHSINTFETISVPWLQLCFLHKRVTRPNKFSCFSPNKTRALKGWKHLCLLQLPIVKWLFPLRGRNCYYHLAHLQTPIVMRCFVTKASDGLGCLLHAPGTWNWNF